MSQACAPSSFTRSLRLGISLQPRHTNFHPRRINLTPVYPTFRQYATMKAVVIKGKEVHLVQDKPIPKLRDDYVLVKPHAIALNPTDWKHAAFGRAKDGALVGCDYAGVVEEVGPAVTKAWKKGDRICGSAHGSNLVNEEDGCFSEYAVVKGDVQMRIPDGLAFEKAATISLAAITVGQGLYQKSLRLNLPINSLEGEEWVLIYGGGTSTGGLAIQYMKLYVRSGFNHVRARPDLKIFSCSL